MPATMPLVGHSRCTTQGPDVNKQMPILMAAAQPAQADTSQLSVMGPTMSPASPPPHVCPSHRIVQIGAGLRSPESTMVLWRLPGMSKGLQRDSLMNSPTLPRRAASAAWSWNRGCQAAAFSCHFGQPQQHGHGGMRVQRDSGSHPRY